MTRQSLIVIAACGSVILLAGAFVFQALGFAPCQLCLWQRWPHAFAVCIGLFGLFFPSRLIAIVGALALGAAAGLGIYHTGVEQGWWQGPNSCSGDQALGLGNLTGADLLSTENLAPIVMCDEVVWSLFTLSMASWNALISIGLILLWLWAAAARA